MPSGHPQLQFPAIAGQPGTLPPGSRHIKQQRNISAYNLAGYLDNIQPTYFNRDIAHNSQIEKWQTCVIALTYLVARSSVTDINI